ncbi:hypothetical protein GCM10011487_11000 [Steroidobacter agaridevorans]|uniref:3-keto-alpha-glucoside-1,2-lyase/3-keto-2-hydroxy-glucal hydratase domain-containing protein n=2 Tax=Steroidobacter agaridevorans TaxID=2695856 RepID=A0A829Y7A0_9GAMM|nr:DUF1080 domain-containing protein [Steroidobacter agaridevorans]GFE79100.1 hypothetical protein GCM10011487_11000 [Steroidobacter agaridevorans]GFE88256.1 hypothetical protein GCM10011488_32100 [Steroidobacter agaridevorans]
MFKAFNRGAPWVAVLAATCAMTASADDGGNFKPLFNGKNLDGWKHVGPGEFVVENGALKSVGGMGLLFYPGEKFGNAVIRVVYKVSGDSNSGVFIRIPEQPTEPWMPVNKGYEVQIDDSDDDWHRTGVLYSFTKTLAQPKTGEWNTMEITLEDERTVVTVNGTKVTDFKEGSPVPEKKQKHEPDRGKRAASGYIGLQNHNDKDVVYFKEVSVKKLK